ncbi:GNAT family N-acetyltransferase [Pseudomonas sp. 681]|uniref:GNAT family N-acetyltransferase n=1 Tax=Pseudomonas fungipugnans TaxID=3024217 RepID=A0ABT6QLI2_9PSED|nr:GNAT family N-acetyltransferase [Pseudomonas sp. 681]MDI2591743.1 GNAT family N-acetyltransferase [Pseudomonas sp. 681]
MITALAFSTIEAIDRCAWNDCFADGPQDWDYYRCVEQAGITDFQWRYLALYEDDVLIAAAVAFITAYSLDTRAQGLGRRICQQLRQWWPGLFEVRTYVLGAPLTHGSQVATAPSIDPSRRPALLDQLLSLARSDADHAGIGLLAVKDASDRDPQWLQTCREAGLQSLPERPDAELSVAFGSVDAYLGSLDNTTRRDLRRLLRGQGPRVEWRRSVEDVLPRMMALYETSLAQRKQSAQRLPPAWFQQLFEHLDSRVVCVLYWVGDELVAFNLVMLDKQRLVDKLFAHDQSRTVDQHWPLRRWLVNVSYCIEHRIAIYASGKATDANTRHLGCSLTGNTLFFRHRNPALDTLLRVVKVLIRADRSAPVMAAAISETR